VALLLGAAGCARMGFDVAQTVDISSASPYDFGATPEGTTALHVFTVTNRGKIATRLAAEVGPAPAFPFAGGAYPGTSGTCGSDLAAEASCTVAVAFAPQAPISYTGALTVSYAMGAGVQTVVIHLTGAGTSIVAVPNGWSDVRAIGARLPQPGSGLPTSGTSITIAWRPMTLTPEVSVTTYSIYRSTVAGQPAATSLLTSGLDPAQTAYTDTSVTAGVTYFYTVRPVVGTAELATSDLDTTIEVMAPPDGMALVHQWIANQEMCTLMGRAVDRTNGYRCEYLGPGGDGAGHFDLGSSFLVDIVELGCNYTAPPACGDPLNGCLGTSSPMGVVAAATNSVYYDRTDGQCYINTSAGSGTQWTSANDPGLTLAQRASLAANIPGLPPLSAISDAAAWNTCVAASASGIGGTKRLLSRREQVAASAWSPALDDATISALENGLALPQTGYCNSNGGDGLIFDNMATPADLDTLPSTLAGGHFAVRTGSVATRVCVSRYGIQDLVGNVWEWTSDHLATCDPTTNTCLGMGSAYDLGNVDFSTYALDGAVGPGSGASGLTSWELGTLQNMATQLNVPLGLPLVTGAPAAWDSLPIGTGGVAVSQLHDDVVILDIDNENGVPARGTAGGGAWDTGPGAGRFALALDARPQNAPVNRGVRCALPMGPPASPATITARHHGWLNVKALGATTPVAQSLLTPSPAAITLSWLPMSVTPAVTITGYSVFRATSSGGENFASPLAAGLSTSDCMFTDNTVAAGITYFYVVRPEYQGATLATSEPDSEIAVLAPWANMALIHRWIANQDLCTLMRQNIDRSNNYRCSYTGFGDDGAGHFDVGHSFLFDVFETGCNYTPKPGCGDAVNGCLGTASPSGTKTATKNSVFYDRSTSNCWINTSPVSGTTWTAINSGTLTPTQLARVASNQPGLPPLSSVYQTLGGQICAAFSLPRGTERLPGRMEHVLALSWDPTVTDSAAAALENGFSLPTTGACNSNLGDGLTYDNQITPADLDTLPYTLAATGNRAVRTGSKATRNCVSRYGVRDGPGNLTEFDSDQMTCNATTNICLGVASGIDATNTLWNGFRFDGTQGPGGGSDPTLDSWPLAAETYGTTRFLLPVGLPLVTASPLGMPIGTSPGNLDPAALHGDGIWVVSNQSAGTTTRGAASGGAWADGACPGRYTLTLQWTSFQYGSWMGMRCAISVP